MNLRIPCCRRTAFGTAVAVAATATVLGSAGSAIAEPTRPGSPPVSSMCAGWTPQTLPTLAGGRGEIIGGAAGGTVWAGIAVTRGAGLQLHAALWRAGQIVDLGAGPVGENEALDVNTSGVAVGDQVEADGSGSAVMWRNGQLVRLAVPPGSLGGVASGINDAGLIVGAVEVAGSSHAAAWSADHPERLIDLGTADGQGARLRGVSESGVVAGEAFTDTTNTAITGTVTAGLRALPGSVPGAFTRAAAVAGRLVVGNQGFPDGGAVLWDGGSQRHLSDQDTDFATAVNPAGLVTGTTDQGAVVWQGGQKISLAAPSGNTFFTRASAISNDGRIGGSSAAGENVVDVPTIWSCRRPEPRVPGGR